MHFIPTRKARTIIAARKARTIIAAVIASLLLTLVSCSNGLHVPSGKAEARGAKGRPNAAGGSSALPQLPKTLPPASIFMGSATWRATPSRYCLQGTCRSLPSSSPKVIDGSGGSPVFFSLSAAPVSARLEIHPGDAGATVVPLDPGTAMVWQASLPEGTYPITLVATYKQSEVAWPFLVRLSPAPLRGR